MRDTVTPTTLSRPLPETDPELAGLIDEEDHRQCSGLQLIASENTVSVAVRQAAGSCLTNKYAEGRPGARYYAGCEVVDEVERLAERRAKELFQTDYHVNVQPHAGTQANLAVYRAVLQPGDRMLAMDLAMGGHLSHGFHLNQSGKLYDPHFYGVSRETEQLDYDQVLAVATEVKPKLIVCGASAYPRTIDFSKFAEIAKAVGALLMADMAHIAGVVAAELHPSPFGQADFVTTTTHKTLRGPRGGLVFCRDEFRKKINSAVFPGGQGGPLMHQIAGKAAAFHEALQPEFRSYQQRVVDNSRALADQMGERGYRQVGGGTDNHMSLVDLGGRMTGQDAENLLRDHRIYVNKNLIPFDQQPPMKASGIRIGSPAMTSRGLGVAEFREAGDVICDVLESKTDGVDERVAALTAE